MRYLMTFSYDGSRYQGYQKQKCGKTIQNELEKALYKIAGNQIVSIHASGRTDAGVHALNQKAHFDLDSNLELDKLRYALNCLIPNDIYIKKIEKVSDNFHARFQVKSKEYIYKLNMGEYNPIEKDYVCQWNQTLDVTEMKRALQYLEGTHDFKSFTKGEQENYIRTIIRTDLLQEENQIIFVFVGTGFLRYQVRNMVGTLIEIGQHKRKSEEIISILKAKNRQKAGITATPVGLYLKEVYYDTEKKEKSIYFN